MLLFVILICGSQFAFAKTEAKLNKAKKLLDLQSEINGFRTSDKMINSIAKFAEKDPGKKLLREPKVASQIKSDIDGAYINEIANNLNDREIDYLLALYASPMYQKYIKLEREFWNNKANQVLSDKLSLYQKIPAKK